MPVKHGSCRKVGAVGGGGSKSRPAVTEEGSRAAAERWGKACEGGEKEGLRLEVTDVPLFSVAAKAAADERPQTVNIRTR